MIPNPEAFVRRAVAQGFLKPTFSLSELEPPQPETPIFETLLSRGLLTAEQAIQVLSSLARVSAAGAESPALLYGRYLLLKRIGRGGMAEVWRAHDRNLGRDVAVKFLESDNLKRFRREAAILAVLEHPHIAEIYDIADVPDRPFIVTRFVDGPPIDQADLPRLVAVRLLADICDAVQYAHEQNVLHRDIKPSNILVDGSRHAWLIDFGLAKIARSADALTATAELVGTPTHMAPEQAMADAVDARTDVYGLGATLYDLLTGRPPFQSDIVYEIIRRVVEEPVVPPRAIDPEIPADLERIVLKAMAKKPADRYPSAHALASDLRRFLQGKRIVVPASPPKPRATRKAALAWIAAACVLVSLTLTTILVTRGSSPRLSAPTRLSSELFRALGRNDFESARRIAPDDADLARFFELDARADAAEPERAVELYDDALRLFECPRVREKRSRCIRHIELRDSAVKLGPIDAYDALVESLKLRDGRRAREVRDKLAPRVREYRAEVARALELEGSRDVDGALAIDASLAREFGTSEAIEAKGRLESLRNRYRKLMSEGNRLAMESNVKDAKDRYWEAFALIPTKEARAAIDALSPPTNEPYAKECKLADGDEGMKARGVIHNPTSKTLRVVFRFQYRNAENAIISYGFTEFRSVEVGPGAEVAVEEACPLKTAVRAELLLNYK